MPKQPRLRTGADGDALRNQPVPRIRFWNNRNSALDARRTGLPISSRIQLAEPQSVRRPSGRSDHPEQDVLLLPDRRTATFAKENFVGTVLTDSAPGHLPVFPGADNATCSNNPTVDLLGNPVSRPERPAICSRSTCFPTIRPARVRSERLHAKCADARMPIAERLTRSATA